MSLFSRYGFIMLGTSCCLALSGCSGFGGFLRNTMGPNTYMPSHPTAPNAQLAQGVNNGQDNTPVTALQTQQGQFWTLEQQAPPVSLYDLLNHNAAKALKPSQPTNQNSSPTQSLESGQVTTIPNGDGTDSVISPNGSVSTVPSP